MRRACSLLLLTFLCTTGSAQAVTVSLDPFPSVTPGLPATFTATVNLAVGEVVASDFWAIAGFTQTNGGPSFTLTGAQTSTLSGSVGVFFATNTNFGSDADFGTVNINPVPEPSTFLLAGVGLIAAAARRRRLQTQAAQAEGDGST